MSSLFDVQVLSRDGIKRALTVRSAFDELYRRLDVLAGADREGREFAIVCTKLEEACFFAMKMISLQVESQGVRNALEGQKSPGYWRRLFHRFASR